MYISRFYVLATFYIIVYTPHFDSVYTCICLFSFGTVAPNVTVTFSRNPVMVGSSVNVTCNAVSYPPATPFVDTVYIFHHPNEGTKQYTYASSKAVIYEISSATKNDAGYYGCHVTVMTTMSEIGEAYLNVVNGKVFPLHLYNYTSGRGAVHSNRMSS